MSLRRQNLSPAANLLRKSRLFSLPTPFPRPNVSESFGVGNTRSSDTATLPYPTHQAIATTPSSLARGDWGLKRPLPSRSRILQTSNPVVRVKQLDTIEHVTDYDSAADHVRSRQKFEELNIPVLKGLGQFRNTDLTFVSSKSSFEKRADVTSYENEEGLDGAGIALEALKQSVLQKTRAATDDKTFTPFKPPPPEKRSLANNRWKHEGPWLPGMGAADFTGYINKQISSRAAEFNKYLIEYVKGQIYTRRSQSATQEPNMPLDPEEAQAYRTEKEREWSDISSADVDAVIDTLRAQCAKDPLNSILVKDLIIPFLRLPPINVKSTEYASGDIRTSENARFSDETTPSSTHPSAGLSYLRTRAYLSNHPILGPQASPSPVTSRVIQPRQTATGFQPNALLGVAGFVAEDEHRMSGTSATRGTQGHDVQRLNVDTYGGQKIPVQPHFAAVTPSGRVWIKTERSYGAALAVSRGQLDEQVPERESVENKPADSLSLGASGIPELDAQTESRVNDFFSMVQESENQKQNPKASSEPSSRPSRVGV